ncbi:MAG: DUF6913 domain-containing protein [Chitinophagales bacterium]
MIRKIKNRLFGRFVNSKKYTDTHVRKALDYDHIKSMAFLVEGSDPIALRELLNHLNKFEKDGKKVTYLGYVKKFPPFEDEITWITKKDLSWIGIPTTKKIKHFIEKEFDVLINTSMKTIRPLEYVSTYSKAGLRIGKFDDNKTFCYDFMMNMDDNNVITYLEQVERYLRMLKA